MIRISICVKKEEEKDRKEQKKNLHVSIPLCTYAIFSEGEHHGSSNNSSSLSSLFSPSKPSSPDILNDDDVNISGTGNIDGLRLPVYFFYGGVVKNENERKNRR